MAAAYAGRPPARRRDRHGARLRRASGCRRSDSSSSSTAARTRIERGPKAYDIKHWLATALPILMAEGFYLMLANADVLMLQQFRSPEEVAVYYAAAKTLALVSFVHFAIAATTAHRFSAYHANGDREGLADFLRQSIRWTFWPSLVARVAAARLRQAAAVAVRPGLRRRLPSDVHSGDRAPGARRGRADGAHAQHARPTAACALACAAAFARQYRAVFRC